jgi:apolipoprotein D and lipocalin family protein
MQKSLGILFCLLVCFGASAKSSIKTMESVDVSKFLGTWYRISANPIIFEPKCECARQVLSATEDGRVAVHNSCVRTRPAGKLVEIKGFASAIDNSGAKLAVDFGLPWKGSYWILGFDAQEGYAIVTDQWGYSLYIMSRQPDMDAQLYSKVVGLAQAAGVKTHRLQIQSHANCTYP